MVDLGQQYGGERLIMARNTKYILMQATRIDGKRYSLGMTGELLEVATKEQLKDLLERGIVEEAPDVGASVGGDEPDARDELIESLNADNDSLRATMGKLVTEGNKMSLRNSTLFDANADLNKQIKDLQTENANVKRELQDAGDNSQAGLKKAQVENERLRAEIETLKTPTTPPAPKKQEKA